MGNNERSLEVPVVRTPPNGASELRNEPREHRPSSVSPTGLNEGEFPKLTMYEFIDSQELARRLTVPASWIRDQVRARSQDPLPHVNLGKYVRFLWGSPALELWIQRHIVTGNNNRRLGRTRRKEQV